MTNVIPLDYEGQSVACSQDAIVNDPDVVREMLNYHPETGTFVWRERGREWFKTDRQWKLWNLRFAGKPAGSAWRNKRGYTCWDIKLLGRGCRAHRIAWVWMTGERPPEQIDHKDGDALNNRWSNLRDGSGGVNHTNKSRYTNNKSGVAGVHWRKDRGCWQAQVMRDGRRCHLGFFNSIDTAADAVSKARLKLGFTDRHGDQRTGRPECQGEPCRSRAGQPSMDQAGTGVSR